MSTLIQAGNTEAKALSRAGRIFFAGDTSYTQQLLLDGVVDGVSESEDVAKQTLQRIQHFLTSAPTIYLPSHDPESEMRLTNRTAVSMSPEMVSGMHQT